MSHSPLTRDFDNGARTSAPVPLSNRLKNAAPLVVLLVYALVVSFIFRPALTAYENNAATPDMLVGP
jgi:hypothetical protein